MSIIENEDWKYLTEEELLSFTKQVPVQGCFWCRWFVEYEPPVNHSWIFNFGDKKQRQEVFENNGECRRRSPVISAADKDYPNVGHWPEVNAARDFCGDFESKGNSLCP